MVGICPQRLRNLVSFENLSGNNLIWHITVPETSCFHDNPTLTGMFSINSILLILKWTFGRTRKLLPPPWFKGRGGGGWWKTPRDLVMLQYFEKIPPLVESLWWALLDEVYIMVCGAAGSMLRHQMWQPSWTPSRILQKLWIEQEKEEIEHFFAGHKHFAAFCPHCVLFISKHEKKTYLFLQKMAWAPAIYEVIPRSHSNRCSPILCENVCKAYVHSYWKRQVEMLIRLGKIQEKIYWGRAHHPLPPLTQPHCTPKGEQKAYL